jgi:steroid 5-alpha reductase family enzyme
LGNCDLSSCRRLDALAPGLSAALLAIGHGLLIEFIVAMVLAVTTFIVAQQRQRYDLADVMWGLLFVGIALAGLLTAREHDLRSYIVAGLVTVWGLRLARHIYARYQHKTAEDRRYADMRAQYTSHPVALPLAKIFISQGLLALVITLPVTIALAAPSRGLDVLDVIGVMVWLVGFYFESVGDRQLRMFLAEPSNRGHLMTGGLWRYSRHPNYFGELTQWWGIGLLALLSPLGVFGLIGPIVITILIVFVSGVPLLERHYAGRTDWEQYKARTSMLLPLPPRETHNTK